MNGSGKNNAIDQTVEDLVIRSRLGDQVASATLVVIGQEAKKGQTQAIQVRDKVVSYIKEHPQDTIESIAFGVETPQKQRVIGDACILKRNLHSGKFTGAGLALLLLTLGEYSLGVLTHGPSLLMTSGASNPIVDAVRSALTAQVLADAFDFGNSKSEDKKVLADAAAKMSEESKRAMQLGMIIGRARRLQAICNPGVPLSVLCEMTAWELGE